MSAMTNLEKAIKALQVQAGNWFGDAILNGAEVRKVGNTFAYVDGVLLLKPDAGKGADLIIQLRNEELDKLWKPSADDLQQRKAELETELEQINNQIKETEK